MARERKKSADAMSTDSGSESTGDLHDALSDESSFYGDSYEKERLEELVSDFDVVHYWEKIHPRSLATIQSRAQKADARAAANAKVKAKAASEQAESDSSPAPKIEPDASEPSQVIRTNPRTTRQASESVEEFLSRLPPSMTKAAAPVGPWIYIYNHRENLHSGSVSTLVARGTELLRNYENEKSALEVEHHKTTTSKTKSSSTAKPRSNAALGRKLVPLRRNLETSLFALARETGVVSGKWMLFPTAEHVDEVWAAVVEATANDELGVAAKVATDDESGGGRLVAIYTRDYEDKKDVKRVLEKLVELGLVDRGAAARPIYYKCDAYTYLDIKSTNTYGLKASLYSSRDALGWKG
ncbi:hypothetical protein AOR_1_2402174 [Paecilomyces variotii No. 5]|uniref:DUF1917-domain-containing protein n=1 Tax=Byssochlamys spectabilis (strain No. 5 / NBRC 109023) TaxID=1356009 RepID=V5FN69_BYSSN|nr:hypothetical protein AOR_1_2402174 [Paecilomyces variotii No. 5]